MKKLFLALITAGVMFSVQADYIYWMVESNPIDIAQLSGGTKSETWDNAILSYDGTQIGSMTVAQWEDLDDVGAYAYASFTSTGSDSSVFMIELYNEGKWLGKTEATAGALAQYIFTNNSMSSMPAAGFGQAGTGTYAVPEPTSGLLFLVGGMLLGLKRRRMA